MNRKLARQLIHIAAACMLWLATLSYAAEEAIDRAIPSSRPSSSESPITNGPILPTYGQSNGQPASSILEPFDPNAPPRATIPIGPNLFVGGYTSLEGETNRHYDLSSTFSKADSTLTPIFAPAFAYEPNQYLQLYVNPVLEIPIAVEEIEDRSQTTELNMNLA
ncbi:MAG TPA: hypothetical protein DDY39_15440, partial [Nitrospira sp.]|nr:hypothetical protein [Nitrospira sp.]